MFNPPSGQNRQKTALKIQCHVVEYTLLQTAFLGRKVKLSTRFFFIRTSSLRTFLKMFLTLDQQEAIYFVLIKKTCSLHKIGMYGKTLGENREINNKIGKNQNFHILVVSIGILP